jgi:hypothetical protein
MNANAREHRLDMGRPHECRRRCRDLDEALSRRLDREVAVAISSAALREIADR